MFSIFKKRTKLDFDSDEVLMFPSNFTILITDDESNMPIKNILIAVTIFANHKNNYCFIPHASNEEGIIQFSREVIENEIEIDRNLFIMDYASTLKDCMSKIRFEILSSDSIIQLISAMEKYSDIYNYHNDIKTVQNSNNYKYQPKSEVVTFEEEQSIYFNIKLRKK